MATYIDFMSRTNFIDLSDKSDLSDYLYSRGSDDVLALYTIPGILELSSNFTGVAEKKGYIKKRFRPLQIPSLSKLPDIMVQTNRLTKKDMFVIVSISLGKSADVRNAANNMHTLRASIIEYVCDADSPYIPSAMNRIATCHWKHKLNYTISQTDPMADDRVPYDDMSITTISVDPENCVDVDDAISIKRLPNNTLQIGIHIADPTS